MRLHEQQKVNLEQEITQFRDEAAKQRKIIYQLEKERDRSEFRNSFLVGLNSSQSIKALIYRGLVIRPYFWLYVRPVFFGGARRGWL